MKYLIIFLFLISGCSTSDPQLEVKPLCRHLAPFGALTWHNLTGEKTVIVMGPTNKAKLWHAQAAIIDDDFKIRRWLVWNGKTWSVGKKEGFEAKDLVDVESFFSETLTGEYGGVGSPSYLKSITVKRKKAKLKADSRSSNP